MDFANALRRVVIIILGSLLVARYRSFRAWTHGERWSTGESWCRKDFLSREPMVQSPNMGRLLMLPNPNQRGGGVLKAARCLKWGRASSSWLAGDADVLPETNAHPTAQLLETDSILTQLHTKLPAFKIQTVWYLSRKSWPKTWFKDFRTDYGPTRLTSIFFGL